MQVHRLNTHPHTCAHSDAYIRVPSVQCPGCYARMTVWMRYFSAWCLCRFGPVSVGHLQHFQLLSTYTQDRQTGAMATCSGSGTPDCCRDTDIKESRNKWQYDRCRTMFVKLSKLLSRQVSCFAE